MGWMALFDENKNVIGMVGDEPWDIMAAAIQQIVACYEEEAGRKPSMDELEQVFHFTANNIVKHTF